jgi:hypothetical protein
VPSPGKPGVKPEDGTIVMNTPRRKKAAPWPVAAAGLAGLAVVLTVFAAWFFAASGEISFGGRAHLYGGVVRQPEVRGGMAANQVLNYHGRPNRLWIVRVGRVYWGLMITDEPLHRDRVWISLPRRW